MNSIFKPFRTTAPRVGDADSVRVEAIRSGLLALAATSVSGGFLAGWAYSTSFGEPGGGTAARPSRIYFRYAGDGKTIVVKAVLTWADLGLISKAAFYWSDDDQASFASMVDVDGNFVVSIAYDADDNVSSYSWGAAP